MYWQVYLHKTSVAYEKMLIAPAPRQRNCKPRHEPLCLTRLEILSIQRHQPGSILNNNPECLENFIQLDDNDIWTALKVWSRHSDKVLSTLSASMINRNIFKVEISPNPISEERKKN